jgi:hypothetical protein
MEINPSNLKISEKEFHKIIFIYNALQDGWTIKKRCEKYIFTKHNNKDKEVYMDNFLEKFIIKNFNLDKFI